jgi:uncharacterized protein (DUF488 family)
MNNAVYTVGHSTHSIEVLIELLREHQITAVGDVRSRPYSRMNPQFNREDLKASLSVSNIKYVFLGNELGARSGDKSCYRNGQVQYDLLAKTEVFQEGIRRVAEGAKVYRIALMCAEKEPLECHRTILVARQLVEDGLIVKHILSDGQVEDHAHAVERLISQLNLPTTDMFRDYAAMVRDAYARQASSIAYREEDSAALNLPLRAAR